ncbi:MAG: 4-hydroxythreonine-4-phosphate dehydrogenase PdxA [Cyclobacteriaceae bacterium]|nr:4-hydroxythreonine-4-phosphate dehydrogenase PdxA [Cyclobacteriaceae bacterium HetDA_MAG_MS6]
MKDQSNSKKQRPIVGITIGDINGVGPEVIIKALEDNRVTKYLTPVIYCSAKVISFYRKQLDKHNFNYFQCKEIGNINPKKVNVLNLWEDEIEINPGTQDPKLGKYTKISLSRAVKDLKSGLIHGMVTAPLSKEMVQDDEFNFPGHTEYLTSAFEQKDSLMLMVRDDLRVGVVTGHIPLRQVPDSITKELVASKLKILLQSLKKDFGIKKPKVAVLGLNPHAGENGLLGEEEQQVLQPVIKEIKEQNNLVFGPYPADGFFGSGQYKQFDGILAMYHDQGLIPFKYIAFGGGVNFTAGIPAIRTSPDHGTAFTVAGRNQADPTSMLSAIFQAHDLIKQKMSHHQ